MKFTPKRLINNARNLRRDMTKPERIIWRKLREFPPEYKLSFRRQHPVPPYILDFACIKIKLVIEIDGDSHDLQQQYDKKRDNDLSSLGYRTLRFTNEEIMNNADSVIETILREVNTILKTKQRT